jgi:hypothetical protein
MTTWRHRSRPAQGRPLHERVGRRPSPSRVSHRLRLERGLSGLSEATGQRPEAAQTARESRVLPRAWRRRARRCAMSGVAARAVATGAQASQVSRGLALEPQSGSRAERAWCRRAPGGPIAAARPQARRRRARAPSRGADRRSQRLRNRATAARRSMIAAAAKSQPTARPLRRRPSPSGRRRIRVLPPWAAWVPAVPRSAWSLPDPASSAAWIPAICDRAGAAVGVGSKTDPADAREPGLDPRVRIGVAHDPLPCLRWKPSGREAGRHPRGDHRPCGSSSVIAPEKCWQ